MLKVSKKILIRAIQLFNQKQCLQHASALAFDTALSLVPLLIIISWGIWHIAAIKPHLKEIQLFLINHIINNPEVTTQKTISLFLNQSDYMPTVEIIVLSSVTWLLWRNIVFVFNYIFDLQASSTWIKGIVMSTIALLAPIIIGISLALSAAIESNYLTKKLDLLLPWASSLFSIIAIVFLLFIIFKYLPPKTTKTKSALLSSLITWFSLDLTKECLTWYFNNYSIYHEIYRAYASIPIFLLWLYFAWTIILVGAILTRVFDEQLV